MNLNKPIGPIGVLLGTIIGVGIFGLPYVGYHAGMLSLVASFIVAIGLIFVISEAYGRVIIGTTGRHRLPGYVERYLGYRWKQLALFTTTLGIWGSILSYMLVGGDFLSQLFKPLAGGSLTFYSLVFLLVGAWLIYRDAKIIARVEIILLSLFAVVVILFIIYGWSNIEWRSLTLFNSANLLLPYGIALFALWGVSVLPEASEMIGAHHKRLRQTSLAALVISTVVYLIFVVVIVGVSGSSTTKDALSGLHQQLGDKVLMVGFIFGVIATFTSYLGLGLNLKHVFIYDYSQHPVTSTLMTCLIPLALYLGGLKNFLGVVSIVGGVILGVEGIIILALYVAFARRQRQMLGGNMPKLVLVAKATAVIFALGVAIGLLTPWLFKNIV